MNDTFTLAEIEQAFFDSNHTNGAEEWHDMAAILAGINTRKLTKELSEKCKCATVYPPHYKQSDSEGVVEASLSLRVNRDCPVHGILFKWSSKYPKPF